MKKGERDATIAELLTDALRLLDVPRGDVRVGQPAMTIRQRKRSVGLEGVERRYRLRLVEEVYQCINCLEVWVITCGDGPPHNGGGQRPTGWWKCPNGCNAERGQSTGRPVGRPPTP